MADQTRNQQASSFEPVQKTGGFEATQVDEQMATAKQLPAEGDASELRPGQVLGKCRVVKELGRGGMGAVYLAEHTTLDVKVAVKILPPGIARAHPQFAERFMREAKLAARIQHGNIIQVMDAERDRETGLYYIVMEFVDGGSVRDLMRQGRLDETRAVDIVIKVAEALTAAADLNVVHRDIKPDNIMLTKKGQVKLADLGIAKERTDDNSGITMSSAMMGTPAYISPEQAMDAKNADARADIYSLGATLYHMLVGAPPYEGETTYAVLTKLATDPTPDPRVKRPELSADVAELCMRMMAKSMTERPQSAKELLEELLRVRSALATGATGVSGGAIRPQQSAAPAGTPTQGVAGTTVASVPATAFGKGNAPATAAEPPAFQVSSSGMKMLVAAMVVVMVAGVVGVWALTRGNNGSGRNENPPAKQTAGAAALAPTPAVGENEEQPFDKIHTLMAENPDNHGQEVAMIEQRERSQTIAKSAEIEGLNRFGAEAKDGASAAASLELPPAGRQLEADPVRKALAELERITPEQVKAGCTIPLGAGAPEWPKKPELQLIGVGDTDRTAETAAMKMALGEIVLQVAVDPAAAESRKALQELLADPGKYVSASQLGREEKDGKVALALGLTPKASKLGKFLYANNVKVKDLYALVGKPSVGVDIQEKIRDLAGNEVKADARRAQRTLEKELAQLGVAVVDVAGLSKAEQRQSCDILITGSSEAKMRWNRPLPGEGAQDGGTLPVYVYKCDFSLDVTLCSTGAKIPFDLFSFNPTGKEEFEKFGNHDADAAATSAIEATVSQSLEKIGQALLEAWVKNSSEADYWVGVTGVKGAAEIAAVENALKAVPGVGAVTRRYYRKGTAEFSIQYDGSGRNLGDLIEKESKAPLSLSGQEGLRLEFEYNQQ